jgi:hypothetical protein
MSATTTTTTKTTNHDIAWKESRFHAAPSQMPNIVQSKQDDENDDLFAMFADPDPYQMFEFDFAIRRRREEKGKVGLTTMLQIHIQLHGQKQENGQTLHSTGLTLWRASELLCDYLVNHPELVKDNRVLEVRNFCQSSRTQLDGNQTRHPLTF